MQTLSLCNVISSQEYVTSSSLTALACAVSSLAQLVKQFEKSKPAEPAVKRSWKEIRHEAYKKKTKFGLALS